MQHRSTNKSLTTLTGISSFVDGVNGNDSSYQPKHILFGDSIFSRLLLDNLWIILCRRNNINTTFR